MFNFLQYITSSLIQPSSKNTSTDTEQGNFSSPKVESLVSNDSSDVAVRKEPLLDRSEKVIGYQFLPLEVINEDLNRNSPRVRQLYDAALFIRLNMSGAESLLDQRLAVISTSTCSLNNPTLSKISSINTLLLIDVAKETSNWQSINDRLTELKKQGFLIGLNIRESVNAAQPITVCMDYIMIDIRSFISIDLKDLLSELAEKEYIHLDTQLIASNVQSHEDFQFCHKVGFHNFHGSFVANRESSTTLKSQIDSMVVFSVLNMLKNDQSFALIATEIKNEPTLTYKLLRYVNSAAMGLGKTVNSLTEALILLGRDKLYRWVSLLLFDFEKSGYYENFLAEKALTRARTLELLAGKGLVPQSPDKLFLIGLFSLLDIVLGKPLSELLEKASLPKDVRDTLLRKPGAYTDALNLVALGEANSSADQEQYKKSLEHCGVTDTEYVSTSLTALVWANEVKK